MAIIDLLATAKDGDAVPPGFALAMHVVSKGTELGSLIGLAVGLVACLPVSGGRAKVRRVMEFVEFGEIAFTVVGAATLLYKTHGIEADGIVDRGHRLQHMDPAKTKMDLGFIVGGTITSILFISDAFQEFVGNNVLERMVRGFAFGGAIGFASFGGAQLLWKVLNKTLVMG